jgi:S1-C subfamily serine protease
MGRCPKAGRADHNSSMAREETGVAHVIALLVVVIVIIVLIAAIANELDPTRSSGHHPSHPASDAAAPSTSTTAPAADPPPPVDTATVARQVAPAVVALEAKLPDGERALGSGMVLSSTGEILTNDHVVADATAISARTADGHAFSAHVVGDDATRDVAVVQLDGAANLPTVTFGDSASAAPGTPVVVVDQSTGRDPANAGHAGTVTALGQQIVAGDTTDPDGIETLNNMMQLDTVMDPGGSGGPVTDAHGRVLAMHTAASQGRRFATQTASDVTFAIPIDDALVVVTQIDSGQSAGTVHVGPRAQLGVTVSATGDGSAGVVVETVAPGGPAASAGIAVGDVLAAVDNATVSTSADIDNALSSHSPGDVVPVGWFDAAHTYRTAKVRLSG